MYFSFFSSQQSFAANTDQKMLELKSRFSAQLLVEQKTLMDEKKDTFTTLYARLSARMSKRTFLTLGLDPQLSYRKVNPDESQFTFTTPPFIELSGKGLYQAGPFLWQSVSLRVVTTSKEHYQKQSQYVYLRAGTVLGLAPASFFELYYRTYVLKFINKYEYGPEGSNVNVEFLNWITVQFNLVQGYKYMQNLALAIDIVLANDYAYSSTWKGSHEVSYTLQYDINDKFNISFGVNSSAGNYKDDGRSNFSLFHRNTAEIVFVLGTLI
jgi:hypothetical protein